MSQPEKPGTAWVKTDGGHHVDSPKMAKLLKGRGGPRPGSGPKVGPQGPSDARLNIKCTKAELDRYTAAAREAGLGRSAWVKRTLNRDANGVALAWRYLDAKELPQEGDEGWNATLKRWEPVNVPSMWLAGGKRIRGTRFRTTRPG